MAFDMNQLMQSPWLNMGLGILGANKPGASFGQAVGQGGLLGMQNYQQQLAYQQQQELLKQKLAQEEQARQQEAMRQQALGSMIQDRGMDPRLQYFQQTALQQMYPNQQDKDEVVARLEMAGFGKPGTPQFAEGMKRYLFKPQTAVYNAPTPPAGYYFMDPNSPSAGLSPIPGGPAEKPTEGQQTAAGFFERMNDAADQINSLESSGLNPSAIREFAPAAISNFFASPEFQTYQSAQADWVRAKLRKESGAVIGEEEMAKEIKTYFPQPGDSKRVIERKQKQRTTAEAAMARSAGPQFYRQWLESRQRQPEPAPPSGDVINFEDLPSVKRGRNNGR